MFINWQQREINLKLIYYGPPLSGKTTNLEQIHRQLPASKRGEMLSVKTREDRTLFFDFMELELNPINGLKPKFKLYTVPGQVYYAATRKLVLKDVDGLVFVADSSARRMENNRHSYREMGIQLQELRRSIDNVPLILQCNKQDLPDAVTPAEMRQKLRVPSSISILPAAAVNGQGVPDTLKSLMGMVIGRLRQASPQ
ncbi:MAG: ADP-ribosylation factor-like protein [Chloroflexota bacterium]